MLRERRVAHRRRCKADAAHVSCLVRLQLQLAQQAQRAQLGNGAAQGVAAQHQPAARLARAGVPVHDVDGLRALEEAAVRLGRVLQPA